MEKLKRFLNIIYILWIRQIKRYFRSRARVISALAQPLLFLVALGFGFNSIFMQAGKGNYIEFLAPGVIAMTVVFTAVFSGVEVISDRQFGFLKETLVAPVPRSAIMAGRTLGGATVAVIQGVIVFIASLFVGFHPNLTGEIPVTLLFMFLIGIFSTAFGTAVGSVLQDMQAFPLVINFLFMPMFFISGALFPLENLPKIINYIAVFNPLSYGIDGIRTMLTGSELARFSLMSDFLVMGVFSLALIFAGAYLFSKIEA
ncbi:MAG: ABC transporter permease [Candidatus Pacebacteria bacterium]|nr:ABC transporter permease [Candidatus Paceibacterota bacterium]